MVKDTNSIEEKSVKSTKSITFDINKIVQKARGSYDKKEQGLALQLSTGQTIHKSTDDKDYILWQGEGNYWQALTGLKGLLFGYVYQISGKPDSGKSSTSLCFMKYAQDQGHLVILWDSERKFQSKRFDEKIGGKSDQLLVVNTNKIIDGAKAVAQLVHAAKEVNPNTKILIVWDSVGASLNSSEDNEDDNSEDYSRQPGIGAKETSFAIKKFVKLANKYMNKEDGTHSITTLLINQTYSSIGIGPSTQIEKGGTEIYYLSSVIIQLSRKQDITQIKSGVKYKKGIISRAKVKKNHLFDSDSSIAELDIIVSGDGIKLAKEFKETNQDVSWDNSDESDEE